MHLTEEQARENLKALLDSYYQLSSKESYSESSVLGSYIEPLFRNVLGWPIDDITKFEREKSVVKGKSVDRILHLDNNENIFIEAKRFGLIERLSDSNEWSMGPGQLALPGMAVDRTQEEQQAINYAFENGGKWAVLSNFECLRLFNARRDWLILAFEAPAAYKDDFELLWHLSWDSLNEGSLEKLNSQRVVKDLDTDYLAFINEQREQLATDILLNRDQNSWAYNEDGNIKLQLLRSVVQRILDRLVVIRFAEDHYVIDSRPLWKAYETCKNNPYAGGLQNQLSVVFRSFDQMHNSALFAQSEVDLAQFSDTALFPLFEKLYEARFRAMPADIIGNTYEQYLGKTLVLEDGAISIQDNLETRKAQGSYYTPQYIVRFIVDHTLGRYLYGTQDGKPKGIRFAGEERKTSADIRDLRVLDSACGSGSFLIYAYQVLAEFYQSEIKRLEDEYRENTAHIDSFLDIPIEVREIQAEGIFIRDNYRRLILEKHLYGVDLDPQAAEIAVMNLILRALEGAKASKKLTLPLILNQNIKVGNSLIGLSPDAPLLAEHADALATIRRLRADLVEADHNDPSHREIRTELESATNDLKQVFQPSFSKFSRPFHWAIEFPEVFFDERGHLLENPGFTFVFGNPPYGAKLSAEERKYFRREYNLGMTNTAGLFMAHSIQALRIARGGAWLNCS
ncbi:MAG: N-6 DNA methylase [Chloroflexi bacterium]|nr:N-6 DNA methylase [Chloroflexota bacterium]